MSAGEVAGVRADVLATAVIVIGGCWAARIADRLLSRHSRRHPRSGALTIGPDTPRRLLPFDSEAMDDASEELLAEGLGDVDAELLQRWADRR